MFHVIHLTVFNFILLYSIKTLSVLMLTFIVSIFYVHYSFGQNSKIDSMTERLRMEIHDTVRINILNALAWEFCYSNPDTSILLSTLALKISGKLAGSGNSQTSNVFIASTYHNLGSFYYLKGNYLLSLDYFFKALGIWRQNMEKNPQSSTDMESLASTLCNIGNVYLVQADYPKALKYYYQALNIDEKRDDKFGIASDFGNIGIIYKKQNDYTRAMEYYSKALKMNEDVGDKNGMAIQLGNIGIVYTDKAGYSKNHGDMEDANLNFGKALEFQLKALKIDEEINDKTGMAIDLDNIGVIYVKLAEAGPAEQIHTGSVTDSLLRIALGYYFKSLKMKEEIGDQYSIANTLGNIGSLYTSLLGNKYSSAVVPSGDLSVKPEEFLKKALEISTEINALDLQRNIHQYFSELYYTTGNYKSALDHFKKYLVVKDSLFNEDKSKEMGKLEAKYEYNKQQAVAEAEHKKEIELAGEREKRQRVFIYLIAAVAVAAAVIAFIIFRSLKITKRQKNIIIVQKKLVEQKQEEILASIRYARRIQNAMLPTEKYLERIFKSQ
ncbi:MAG: tetratricopeptide repeat protein [Bacteroidetes bacterium]|nr:tetratricopeptide repeat protein [Bacteroidota bacterium]